MLALSIIQLCARDLQDIAYVRVARDPLTGGTNQANWLDWLNESQRAVVLMRPDAGSTVQSLQLAAGTRQALPAGSTMLLDVTRNMGVDGATPGLTIRFGERGVEDMVSRSWHTGATAVVVKDVLYDDKKNPLVFWVNPPIPAAPAVWIETILALTPASVTDPVAGAITIADQYASPMQEWMLFRAYGMNTQSQTMMARSASHFKAFFDLLGVRMKSQVAYAAPAPATTARAAAAEAPSG